MSLLCHCVRVKGLGLFGFAAKASLAGGFSEGCSAGSQTERLLAARQTPQSVPARRRVLEQQLHAEKHYERCRANQQEVSERMIAFERREHKVEAQPG